MSWHLSLQPLFELFNTVFQIVLISVCPNWGKAVFEFCICFFLEMLSQATNLLSIISAINHLTVLLLYLIHKKYVYNHKNTWIYNVIFPEIIKKSALNLCGSFSTDLRINSDPGNSIKKYLSKSWGAPGWLS